MKILIVEDDTLLLQGLILAAQTEAMRVMAFRQRVPPSIVWSLVITV